jgi:opacity protein-like surface antigen
MKGGYSFFKKNMECSYVRYDNDSGRALGGNLLNLFSGEDNKGDVPCGKLAAGLCFGCDEKFRPRVEVECSLWGSEKSFFPIGDSNNEDWNVKTNMNRKALMLNFYLDIDTETKLTPYISAGAGAGHIKITYDDYGVVNDRLKVESKYSKTKLIWQVGVGCCYAIDEHLAADFGYRMSVWPSFRSLVSTCIDENDDDIMRKDFVELRNRVQHELLLGLRYTF